MKNAEQRAREWERTVYGDPQPTHLADMLREHEADARADERAKVVERLQEHRKDALELPAYAEWTTDEVLEDIDKLIAEIEGST